MHGHIYRNVARLNKNVPTTRHSVLRQSGDLLLQQQIYKNGFQNCAIRCEFCTKYRCTVTTCRAKTALAFLLYITRMRTVRNGRYACGFKQSWVNRRYISARKKRKEKNDVRLLPDCSFKVSETVKYSNEQIFFSYFSEMENPNAKLCGRCYFCPDDIRCREVNEV